jgi:hypothetical protein
VALNRHALALISPYIRGDVLSLGYPDLLVTPEECRALLGVVPETFTDFGSWHGVKHRLPETHTVFAALGARLRCVDITASRGAEEPVDLNYPVQLGSYDLVIDPGTTEHCFNVGVAIMNAANAVKPGGAIFHGPPLSMVNHGFYNFCPTLLHDFYTQNGWVIEAFGARGNLGNGEPVALHPTQRFGAAPEAALYCVAVRKNDAPLKFPTQTKYLNNPGLK